MNNQPSLLSLTPPRHTVVTPASQVEMFAALAHARRATARGVALEIAGEAGHVCFRARTATAAAGQHLAMVLSGYYPQGAVLPLDGRDDPARLRAGESALAADLRLQGRNELPLRTLANDETSAQLLRVVGVLRTLPPGLRGVCQLILWPAPRCWGRGVERWLQQERLHRLQSPRVADAGLSTWPMAVLLLVALAGYAAYHEYRVHDLAHLAELAAAVLGAGTLALARWTVFAPAPPPDLELVERKLATPAFTTRLRLLVAGGTAMECRGALDSLIAAYGGYEEPRGNGFVARGCAPQHLAAITTRGRPRFWGRPWPILSAAEVAALFHLPTQEVELPGLTRTGPRTLLPSAAALTAGTPIGTATLGPHSDAVCIPHAAHGTNLLVLGATGTGKSTFLQHYARDAVAREHVQLVVIDPDSSLVTDMVGWLPDRHKRHAVVIDFGHPERAVGLNLLDAHTPRRTDQIVSSIIQAWARFYAEAWGPRLEDLIRYACATILAANRSRPHHRQYTLLDVKPLLQFGAFREAVVRQAGDIKLDAYWRDDYLGMPRTERLVAIKPVLTRINRFLLNDAAHAVVGQPQSTIDLPALLESGVPLFINAAAHTVGEETAALLDAVLLNIIHDAVCERHSRERQVLIVVDEFQHAPALWDEYLPRIRKFGGSYVLAAQGISTIDRVQQDLHKVVVGNTATHVVFRAPDPDEATYLAAVLDNAVSAEDVQTLGLRQCYLKTSDERGPLPVTSATLPPPPPSDAGTARLIAAACARRYGRPIADVMAFRSRWMTELYHAARPKRTRPAGESGEKSRTAEDDAEAAGPAPEASAGDAETEQAHGDNVNDAEASTMQGSRTVLGISVTRVSPRDALSRRKRRRRKGTNPAQPPHPVGPTLFDLMPNGLDPLPSLPADPLRAQPLPFEGDGS